MLFFVHPNLHLVGEQKQGWTQKMKNENDCVQSTAIQCSFFGSGVWFSPSMMIFMTTIVQKLWKRAVPSKKGDQQHIASHPQRSKKGLAICHNGQQTNGKGKDCNGETELFETRHICCWSWLMQENEDWMQVGENFGDAPGNVIVDFRKSRCSSFSSFPRLVSPSFLNTEKASHCSALSTAPKATDLWLVLQMKTTSSEWTEPNVFSLTSSCWCDHCSHEQPFSVLASNGTGSEWGAPASWTSHECDSLMPVFFAARPIGGINDCSFRHVALQLKAVHNF